MDCYFFHNNNATHKDSRPISSKLVYISYYLDFYL